MRSLFVSHWSIILTMTFLHQIVLKILGKITGPQNIGHWPTVTLIHYLKFNIPPSSSSSSYPFLEPCFPLPRVSSTEGCAFWQVFLEGILSTQNDSEGQQNPYLASFCHSQALHPMISLACQIFSVQTHSACILLQSSLCYALHVQTISSYWCGAPHLSPGCQALWEGSLS